MTLRKTVAIAIMQGLISTNEDPVYAALISVEALNSPDFGTPKFYAGLTAKSALIYTDALLAELKDETNDT